MRTILLFVISTFLFTACGQAGAGFEQETSSSDMSADLEYREEGAQPQATAAAGEQATIEPKIIKNADYRIKVDQVKTSTERIEAMAKAFDGYISEMNLTNSSYQINNAIVIRVPEEHFDCLMARIAEEARYTDHRRIHTQDVTAEYVDLEIRLKTKREVRDRYIDILRTQAKTVEDVLKTEEQLRLLQEEIESAEGRLKYLNSRISLSTINVDIYEDLAYQAQAEYSFGEKILQSLKNGWDLIISLTLGLLAVWPLLLIGAFAFWQRKRIFRFRRAG